MISAQTINQNTKIGCIRFFAVHLCVYPAAFVSYWGLSFWLWCVVRTSSSEATLNA